MNSIIIFLLKSIFVSGILTSWYWLGLRNRRLHNYNRFFLLFTLYASIQLPLLHFQWFTFSEGNAEVPAPAAFLLHIVSDGGAMSEQAVVASSGSAIDWATIFAAIVAIVSIGLLAVLAMRVIWIFRMVRAYKRTQMDEVHLIHTDLPKAPFSFLNYLFWRNSIPLESENGQLILRHEIAHIRQRHTYDKLACQVLTCVCWFNPFNWIIQKELSMLHEFIADEKAISPGDTQSFAMMLLQTHNNGRYLAPEHSFFSSPIKRRLIMLQTSGKTKFSLLRRALVLPIMAGAVLLFSFSARKAGNAIPVRAADKIVLVIDAGHGGIDQGAAFGALKEKDVNLRVAKRLNELAASYNIEAHLTRSGDEVLSLAQRVTISNDLKADDFISIHVADAPMHVTGKGTFDIFISPQNQKQEESKFLARSVYGYMIRQGGIQRGDLLVENKNYFVIKNVLASAIMIELGDIKHREQMAQIQDQAKLDELCNAILKGVVAAHNK